MKKKSVIFNLFLLAIIFVLSILSFYGGIMISITLLEVIISPGTVVVVWFIGSAIMISSFYSLREIIKNTIEAVKKHIRKDWFEDEK